MTPIERGGEGPSRWDARSGIPSRVGKYRIDHVIGRGAIGVVYKGYDEQIDRPLAIKTLRREILDDVDEKSEFLKRFAAEARSAGRCLHPNIVTVFDLVEQDDAPYIVMEYVEAGTLETVIKAGTLLPVRQVGEIVAQLLFALDHAHSKGVIHRDVKPANVLCPSAASIKVADFGVARLDALNLTRTGDLGMIGTPNYMAPERFLGRPADGRADLFSAGVILYQLLTGTKPFIAVDMPELMRKLMNELPPSVVSHRPELWAEIDVVVRRALARNPEDRYQSAEQFIDALNDSIASRPNDFLPALDLTKLSRPPAREEARPAKDAMNQTLADRLSPGAIDALSRSLARSLGPIAQLVVRQASRDATNIDMLLTSLTRQIKTETEIVMFRNAAEKVLREDLGVASAKLEAVISPSEIGAATDALLPIIGPIARVLVKRQAGSAVGREDFYLRLADAIPNERDRASFLAIRDSLPGGKSH